MTYDPTKHNRQSIRLKNYDYTSVGIYFTTFCVEGRVPLFGTIQNGEMHLNTFGRIVAEEWEKSALIRKNISMGEYIIMPDHFHGIIEIKEQIIGESYASPGEFKSPSHTIGAIIRGFKGASTKRIKSSLWISELEFPSITCRDELPFIPTSTCSKSEFIPTCEELTLLKKMNPKKSIWQRNYHDRIIRNSRHLENTINYIKNNPQAWRAKSQ